MKKAIFILLGVLSISFAEADTNNTSRCDEEKITIENVEYCGSWIHEAGKTVGFNAVRYNTDEYSNKKRTRLLINLSADLQAVASFCYPDLRMNNNDDINTMLKVENNQWKPLPNGGYVRLEHVKLDKNGNVKSLILSSYDDRKSDFIDRILFGALDKVLLPNGKKLRLYGSEVYFIAFSDHGSVSVQEIPNRYAVPGCELAHLMTVY